MFLRIQKMCMVCAVAATAAYLSFFPSLLHDNSKSGVKLCYQDLDSPMADLSICSLTLCFLYESSQLHAATVFSMLKCSMGSVFPAIPTYQVVQKNSYVYKAQ